MTAPGIQNPVGPHATSSGAVAHVSRRGGAMGSKLIDGAGISVEKPNGAALEQFTDFSGNHLLRVVRADRELVVNRPEFERPLAAKGAAAERQLEVGLAVTESPPCRVHVRPLSREQPPREVKLERLARCPAGIRAKSARQRSIGAADSRHAGPTSSRLERARYHQCAAAHSGKTRAQRNTIDRIHCVRTHSSRSRTTEDVLATLMIVPRLELADVPSSRAISPTES